MALAPSVYGFGVVLGPLTHYAFWSVGEWDSIFWIIASCAFLAHNVLSLLCALLRSAPRPNIHGLVGGYLSTSLFLLQLEIVYTTSTLASVAVYRAFSHPLHPFPGPFFAKLSVWWRVYHTLRSGDRHAILLQGLHRRYGDIVRIGPNVLSIKSAQAIEVVHGRGSNCTKGPAYLNPMGTCVNWDRDLESHRQRRILWDRALGAKAQEFFAPRISRLTEMLVDGLRAEEGRARNVNRWCHFLAFDVMGEIGFGRSYGQLETGKMHDMMRVIGKYMRFGVYATMVPWLHCFVSRLWAPDCLVEKPDWMFYKFAKNEMRERQKRENEEEYKDVMQVLMSQKGKRPLTLQEMVLDTLIISVGGSDTTNSALLHILYRLARHPEVQASMYDEIRRVSGIENLCQGRPLDASMVANMAYITSVIFETLRLHPSAASGLPRVVPAGGVTIDGFHIPEATNVITPTYAIQRDERYFMHAEKFVPERWTTKRYMVRDPRAFCPFGVGAYGCPGRALAMLEMKIVLAGILRRFQVRKPKGMKWDQIDREINEGWKDCLTTQAAQLELCFIER